MLCYVYFTTVKNFFKKSIKIKLGSFPECKNSLVLETSISVIHYISEQKEKTHIATSKMQKKHVMEFYDYL